MGTFETLPHTADVGFRARGASLSDLFETAGMAMFSFEYNTSTVGFERELTVSAEADDLEGLLVAWLEELIWIHDAEGFVPGDLLVVEVGESPTRREGTPRMKATGAVRGRFIGDWFEQTGPQIKAATFHGLEVKEKRGGWEATVYLDV